MGKSNTIPNTNYIRFFNTEGVEVSEENLNPKTRQDFRTEAMPGAVRDTEEEHSLTLAESETIKAKDVDSFERKEAFNPEAKPSKSKVFYNQLSESLNKMQVGDMLLFALPDKILAHNLRKVMTNRGLREGLDIEYGRAKKDSQGRFLPARLRPITAKKLTDQQATVFTLKG